MLQIPPHVWNDIAAHYPLKTKMFQEIFKKRNPDSVSRIHSLLTRTMTQKLNLSLTAALATLTVLPGLRGYLIPLSDLRDALYLALKDKNFMMSEEERLQILEALVIFSYLARQHNLKLSQLVKVFPETFLKHYPMPEQPNKPPVTLGTT